MASNYDPMHDELEELRERMRKLERRLQQVEAQIHEQKAAASQRDIRMQERIGSVEPSSSDFKGMRF